MFPRSNRNISGLEALSLIARVAGPVMNDRLSSLGRDTRISSGLNKMEIWSSGMDIRSDQMVARLGVLETVRHAISNPSVTSLSLNRLDSWPDGLSEILEACSHIVSLSLRDSNLEGFEPSVLYAPQLRSVNLNQCVVPALVAQDFQLRQTATARPIALRGVPELSARLIERGMDAWVNAASRENRDQRLRFAQQLTRAALEGSTEFSVTGFSNLGELPPELGLLRNVQHLNLRACGATSLPESIGRLSNLRSLDVSSNRLEALPDSIAQLTRLTRILAHSNELSRFPYLGMNASSLSYVALGSNQFVEFPLVLLDCPNLQELHLDGNYLTSVPDSLRMLSNLRVLNLRSNMLARFSLQMLREFEARRMDVDLDDNEGLQLSDQMTSVEIVSMQDLLGDRTFNPSDAGQIPFLANSPISPISTVGDVPAVNQFVIESIVGDFFDGWPAVSEDDRALIRATANTIRQSVESGSPESASSMEPFLSNMMSAIHRMQPNTAAWYKQECRAMFKSMNQSPTLFEELCNLSLESTTSCADRTLWVFSEMKMKCLFSTLKYSNDDSTWQKVLDLGRENFQLKRCEDIAQKKIESIMRANPRFSEQLEVMLFYRVRFQHHYPKLDFGQAMFYPDLAHVSALEVEHAEQELKGRVKLSELVGFLKTWGPWVSQCETSNSYRQGLERIDESVYSKMEKLFEDKEKMSSQDFATQSKLIQDKRLKLRDEWTEKYTAHKLGVRH